MLVEAALIGLLASVLGIAGGFGFVELIKALFRQADILILDRDLEVREVYAKGRRVAMHR